MINIDKDVLIVGALIVAILLTNYREKIPERNDQSWRKSELTPGARLLDVIGEDSTTTYKFGRGDWSKLNLAQRILYPFVPSKWLFE